MEELHHLISKNKRNKLWQNKLHWYLSPEAGRSKVLQIKNFLMYMFQAQAERFGIVSISSYSPVELARMFRCSVEDVLRSLNELNEQGYEFVCHSDHEPVVMRDALAEQTG